MDTIIWFLIILVDVIFMEEQYKICLFSKVPSRPHALLRYSQLSILRLLLCFPRFRFFHGGGVLHYERKKCGMGSQPIIFESYQ